MAKNDLLIPLNDDTVIPPGEMIAELRQLKNMSQRELSALTGIAQPHISALEQGKETLGVERCKVIAVALGVHPAVIMFSDWNQQVAS